MELRFNESEIESIAGRYEYPEEPPVGERGEICKLSKEELRKIAKWKSLRSAGHVEKNSEEYINAITSFVFSTDDERSRIQALTLLDGVGWPTASVILHFCHADPYPILDWRALWSASTDEPSQYNFNFWWRYVEFCRGIVKRKKVTMRELDRAMWQYSRENQ